MTTEDKLRAFIVDELQRGAGEVPQDDYPLIERGVMDSMGILSLVSFIESDFGVEIRDEELVVQHFGTISNIARLIESKN